MLIRAFVIIFIAVIVLDTLPGSWPLVNRPKAALSEILKRIGLAQGEWTLFSPNPDVDNGWLSASLESSHTAPATWISPQWSDATAWEKFYRFRHVNFYNRLASPPNLEAWDDFADYLARSHFGNQASQFKAEVSLYRNNMKMLMPSDGTLPSRDEESWLTSNELITKRSY